MAENTNSQEVSGRLLAPATKHLRRSYRRAIAERDQWFRKRSPIGCGLMIVIGLAVPIVFYFAVPVKLLVMLILLAVYLLAFAAAAVLFSRGNLVQMPEIFARYEEHVRHILFEERLLALLLADPGRDLPGMAFSSGLPGQPDIHQTVDPDSLEQRLILLQSNYEGVCKHFHVQPYPDPVDGKRLSLAAPASARLASVAATIALYEALVEGGPADEGNGQDSGYLE